MNKRWLFVMAWRDSRKNRGRLVLFLSSIVLGIAALVAINSFGENLNDEIQGQAKELLGSDLSLSAASDTASIAVNLPKLDSAREMIFATMVSFPGTDGQRLTQVRGLQGDFPFYGPLVTEPANAYLEFQEGARALVDRTLMMQFDVRIGEKVRIGAMDFEIYGILDRVPGQSGIVSTVAPAVYIPMQYIEGTQLVQRGSRINYITHYKLAYTADPDKWVTDNRQALRASAIRSETVKEKQEDTGRAFSNLNRFLSLVAFVALLLGCVGVASAIHIYIREKVPTVAILRCLGATGKQAFVIFLWQIALMGLFGALAGAFLGVGVQQFLPAILGDFLPVTVETSISWKSVGLGIITGVVMAVLFALAPLLQIRNASPLITIRSGSADSKSGRDPLIWLVYALVLLFIWAFSFQQLGEWRQASFFTLGLLLAFGILGLVSKLVIWLVRKFFPVSWGFVWRQSLANLYRPHNQTLILISTIGLGTALVSTIFYVQEMLIKQVEITGEADRPNLLLFDIQNSQLDELKKLVEANGLEVMQTDPVVNMRVINVKGYNRQQAQDDSTLNIRNWVFTREYRVSYQENLRPTERITSGEWVGRAVPGEIIPISIEVGFARSMGVALGDKVVFDVQGVPMECEVKSLRNVEWNRISSNFVVTFPAGVLENAPQFHVLVTKVPGPAVSARFQQAILRDFPTISIVDLGQIISTVEDVLNKVAFVIRFMALFSILTGLIVLMGSVSLSKYQRLQESVLLRTLGSSRKQLQIITLFEYFILGSLASLTGIVIAFAGTWALGYYSFETVFQPAPLPVVFTYFIITGLTMLIGFFNSRSTANHPPLEILRAEA
jgi:putative ABC transport system permease protein